MVADDVYEDRDRLLDGDVATAFFEAVRLHAESERLLSHEHFTVDGMLLEAWASHKSFKGRDTRRTRRPTRVGMGGGFPGRAADECDASIDTIRMRGCTKRASAGRRSWPMARIC